MSENHKTSFSFEDIQPKDERIGARIKPQYRRMLDIIARDRQTNISEVLELAIHKLSESYTIENQTVLNFVGYAWEHIELLFYGLRSIPLPPEKSIMQKEYLDIRKEIMDYLPDEGMPLSLYSPQERYVITVLNHPRVQYDSWYTIMPKDLLYFVYKSWHIGQSAELSIEILHYADKFTRSILWEKYTASTTQDELENDISENSNIFFQGLEHVFRDFNKKINEELSLSE